MIDETTSIADEKHLAIVSKHMSCNVPVLSFIGLVELSVPQMIRPNRIRISRIRIESESNRIESN